MIIQIKKLIELLNPIISETRDTVLSQVNRNVRIEFLLTLNVSNLNPDRILKKKFKE